MERLEPDDAKVSRPVLRGPGGSNAPRLPGVNNNPVRYNDPTGHGRDCGIGEYCPDGQYVGSRNLPVKPPVVNRSQWGARAPGSVTPASGAEFDETPYAEDNPNGYKRYSDPLRSVLDTVVIHHEGDDATYDVSTLQLREMENGWYDLPYHYIVAQDGTIYEGRPIDIRGGHVQDGNTGKVGVLWLGDFNPGYDGVRAGQTDPRDDYPTQAQYDSTVLLIDWLDYYYGISIIGGHNDFNETICPGANAKPFVDQLKAR